MTERRVAEVYRCAHLSEGWNIVQNKPWHWPWQWQWPCKENTVKLGDKEQIGIKEPFPVTNLPFNS